MLSIQLILMKQTKTEILKPEGYVGVPIIMIDTP